MRPSPPLIALLAAGVLSLAGGASAEVVDSQAAGFEVKEVVDIDAPAAKVWEAMGHVGDWWKSEHSFSGDAHNLSLDLKPGGCFCERLPRGGGVTHMTVIYIRPGETVRLAGALGPLQGTGAQGHMTWALREVSGHTHLSLTYDVGGYVRGGLQSWSKPVDDVLGEQMVRLRRYAETGNPD
jgi:uncharacterized protein YndB with AHSA1/START domain